MFSSLLIKQVAASIAEGSSSNTQVVGQHAETASTIVLKVSQRDSFLNAASVAVCFGLPTSETFDTGAGAG